jgi:hypothetical protein
MFSEGALSGIRLAIAIGLFITLAAGSAAAHEKHSSGRFQLTIGWQEEPAFTGSKNAVSVAVTDAKGVPVPGTVGASLAVEIVFGGERVVLPLNAVFGRPGEFRAWLIPTRPGTYAFNITGKIGEQPIDVRSTCSDKTFDCVLDASELHFPAKDPSTGQLAEAVTRSLPRADRALAAASTARTLATTGLAVAVMALAGAIVAGVRKGPKGA